MAMYENKSLFKAVLNLSDYSLLQINYAYAVINTLTFACVYMDHVAAVVAWAFTWCQSPCIWYG